MVPAMVAIVPVRPTRRMRLLPESAIRKPPSGVAVSPRGGVELGRDREAAVAGEPARAAGHRDDDAVRRDGADAVVAGVGDEHGAVRQGTATSVGQSRSAAVAGPPSPKKPRQCGARDRGDDPVRRHAPDHVVAGVGDEHRAVGGDRHALRAVELGGDRGAAVAVEARDGAGHGRDGPVGARAPRASATASAARAGMSRRVRKDMRGSVARSPPAVCRAYDAPRVRSVTSLLSPGACVTSTAAGRFPGGRRAIAAPSSASSSWVPGRWTGSSASPSTRATRSAARARRRRAWSWSASTTAAWTPCDALALRPQRPGAAHRPPGRRRTEGDRLRHPALRS